MKRSQRLLLIVGLSVPLILGVAWYRFPPLRRFYLELRLPYESPERQKRIFLELRAHDALSDGLVVDFLSKDKDGILRMEALETLADRPALVERTLPRLQAMYQDPSEYSEMRTNAARAIAGIGARGAPAQASALKLLRSGDMLGRLGAAIVLQGLARSSSEALRALASVRDDRHPGVRRFARETLTELSRDPDPRMRERVTQALAGAGRPK